MVGINKELLEQFVLLAVLFVVPAFLQGCVPVVLAAAAGGGYLAADEDAQDDVSGWLDELKKNFKNSKIGDEKAARKSLAYKEGTGLVMEINDFTIAPTRVRRGESVTVRVQYAIAGAKSGGVTVTEQQDLWYKDSRIVRLNTQKIIRDNGTWERTSSFKVPVTANYGEHGVKQSIISDGNKLQSIGFFTVLQ